jgi:predicted Fe-Mo cluster-binding NifX family protein
MKVVFTTSGDNLDAPLDPRFGRAQRFLVYDLDQASFELVENNQNYNAMQGAGVQSAQTVANLGASALVSGHCGPKAFRVLQSAGVKVFNCEIKTIAEALELYRAGKLTEATSADVEGHWV